MSCPTCKGTLTSTLKFDYDFLLNKSLKDIHYLDFCKVCLIAITQPNVDLNAILTFYKKDYVESLQNNRFINLLQKIKYRRDLSDMSKFFPNKNFRILDLGAGSGFFVKYARVRGHEIHGIEFDTDAIIQARIDSGINLELGNFDDLVFQTKYDMIVMRHTLEHSLDPIKLLSNISHNGLRVGGMIVLKIPNLLSSEAKIFKIYWHGFDIPRHRIHFSKKSIINILEAQNFKDIVVKSEIVPLDFYRSIQNYSSIRSSTLKRLFMNSSFKTLFLVAFSPFILILGLFGSSRIVVYAKK